MSPYTILVLEGSLNSSLSVIRSLGRSGAKVTVADHRRISPGLLSKYCHQRIYYPNPEDNRDAFLDFLEDHLKNNAYDLLFPMSDFTVMPIAQNRERFEKYTKIAIPPTEQLILAFDKTLTMQRAKDLGIACPDTIVIDQIEDLEDAVSRINYPTVLKPQSKVTWVGNKPCVNKITRRNYVNSKEQFIQICKELRETSEKVLAQEFIEGEGYGFFALMVKGEPKVVFGHHRLREYPISGGASSLRESYLDDELKESGLKLLKALQWDGIAMVEFRKDQRDGAYKLMEINGRWWGSLALALAAGVDFPKYYAQHLMGEDIGPLTGDFQKGIRCRALIPWDMLWLCASMKRPGRLRAIAEFLKPNGLRFDILSLRDPMPTIGAFGLMMSYVKELATGKLTIKGERKMTPLKLIVHADDLGFSREINEGIKKSFQAGIVTSASIMANAPEFDHALEIIKELPELDVGVHLTLTEIKPLTSLDEESGLIGKDGNFLPGPVALMKRSLSGQIDLKKAKAELRAQIQRVVDQGIKLSHLDGHQHLHLLPGILEAVVELAEEFHIPFIRLSKEKVPWHRVKAFKHFKRSLESLVLSCYSRRAQSKVPRSTDHFFGFFDGGSLGEDNLRAVIQSFPSTGEAELMCHPGYNPPDQSCDKDGYRREDELRALTNPELKELVAKKNIRLTNFRELI